MINPAGEYTFAGLGFIGLQLSQSGGGYDGSLSREDGFTALSVVTYTDSTGIVTFSAGESPAGVGDLNFTGNLILDMKTGNVAAIAGTWTGRAFINAPVAAAPVESAIKKIGPIISFLAHGAWAAFPLTQT
jgi:hypothetical protein